MLTKIKHLKHLRKIRREKPDYWHLPKDGLGYIQIPKVASRSIRIALISHLSSQDASNFSKEEIKKYTNVYSSHISQSDIFNQTSKAFIFSFVRHPYQRIWSCYKNKISSTKITKNLFACHNISLQDNFDTFVDKICEIPDSEADRHFRSQSWFLMNGDTVIPNFVGKLETIQKDWKTMSNQFDLPEIPHRNATEKSYEVSNRNKTLIQQRYQSDFTNFYPDQY